MILYIDETEDKKHFIVVGLLVKTEEEVNRTYSHFKKAIKNYIPTKLRSKVFTEFKAVIIDNDFKRVKEKMLEEIIKLDPQILYGLHKKYDVSISQKEKETIYIGILSKIVASVEVEIDIVFDSFNKKDFEKSIIDEISLYKNVIKICSGDSQKVAGLQFVDNLCSVIRRNKSNADKFNFMDKIKNNVKEIL